MKRVLLLLALALTTGTALAHGRGGARVHLGFNFGFPGYYAPWYYTPAPVYYYPTAPVYVQPPAPTQYVEQGEAAPQAPGTWYFCRESNTYYPYVKQCPGGWTRVPAQPSN